MWIPDTMSRSLEARGGIHPGHRVVVTGHRSGSEAYVADAVTFSNGASFDAR